MSIENGKEGLGQFRKAVKRNSKLLCSGRVIAIDPSSGSRESLPAYACFTAGRLVSSGEIEVPIKLMRGINYLHHRLQFINHALRERHPGKFDVLLMEGIYYKPNRKTNMMSFQALNQSVGAISSALQWDYIIHVYPWVWKELIALGMGTDGKYTKGDTLDAINIGIAAIQIAQEMEAE